MSALTKVGMLQLGLKIGEERHKEYVLREGTAADYFAAETSADSTRSITFQAALVAQQLVRIGTYEGPFTLKMLGKLHPSDMHALVTARQELEAEGEDSQPG